MVCGPIACWCLPVIFEMCMHVLLCVFVHVCVSVHGCVWLFLSVLTQQHPQLLPWPCGSVMDYCVSGGLLCLFLLSQCFPHQFLSSLQNMTLFNENFTPLFRLPPICPPSPHSFFLLSSIDLSNILLPTLLSLLCSISNSPPFSPFFFPVFLLSFLSLSLASSISPSPLTFSLLDYLAFIIIAVLKAWRLIFNTDFSHISHAEAES